MMEFNERIRSWEPPSLVPVLLAPRFVRGLVPVLASPPSCRDRGSMRRWAGASCLSCSHHDSYGGCDPRTGLRPPSRTGTRPPVLTGPRGADLFCSSLIRLVPFMIGPVGCPDYFLKSHHRAHRLSEARLNPSA